MFEQYHYILCYITGSQAYRMSDITKYNKTYRNLGINTVHFNLL